MAPAATGRIETEDSLRGQTPKACKLTQRVHSCKAFKMKTSTRKGQRRRKRQRRSRRKPNSRCTGTGQGEPNQVTDQPAARAIRATSNTSNKRMMAETRATREWGARPPNEFDQNIGKGKKEKTQDAQPRVKKKMGNGVQQRELWNTERIQYWELSRLV